MKKSLLLAFGAILFSVVVYAITINNVNTIPEKNAGDEVSYIEFNDLVHTMKGIFNKSVEGEYHIGINTEGVDNASLKVNGLTLLKPIATGSRPNCNATSAGTIYSDGVDGFLYVCDGTNYARVDGINEYDEYTCDTGVWEKGRTCFEINYNSGNIYNPLDIVCSDVAPNDDTCAACGNITDTTLQNIIANMVGKIWEDVTIVDLEGITTLFVHNTNIKSIAGICKLKNLKLLGIYDSQVSGEIPKEIKNLSELMQLYLNGNQITGEIPKEIGNLTKLRQLVLNDNQITGEIPKEILNFTILSTLILDNNQITGEIPKEIGNLTNMSTLSLSGNQITGEIPKEIGNLIKLYRLRLDNNQITGEIPKEIGNFPRLIEAYLNDNEISGEIPAEIDGLIKLRTLDLSNNKITSIPPEIGVIGALDLSVLDLRNNLLKSIPEAISNTARFVKLDLSNNSDLECFPATRMSSVINLDVSGTKVCCDDIDTTNITNCVDTGSTCTRPLKSCEAVSCSGEITDINLQNAIVDALPARNSWAEVTTVDLEEITVLEANNKEIHNLNGICSLKNIQQLNLGYNEIDLIPDGFWDLITLTSLKLGSNNLTGPIPAEIGNLTNLTFLQLWENSLTGPIPAEIGNLTKLVRLYLDNNDLTGPIPAEIGNLNMLVSLFLDHNNLTGSIPAEIGNMARLEWLQLERNQLTGSIPIAIGNLSHLRRLDFSYNELTGSIPTEIGNLPTITRWIYLSNNQLTGAIPSSMTNLTGLENLYFNGNTLSSFPAGINAFGTVDIRGTGLTCAEIDVSNIGTCID